MVVDYADTDFRTLKSNFFVKTKNGFGLYFYLKKEYIYVCQRLDSGYGSFYYDFSGRFRSKWTGFKTLSSYALYSYQHF